MMFVKNIAIVFILFSFSGCLKKENGEKIYSSGQEDGMTKGNAERLDAKETALLEKLMARDATQGFGMFSGMIEYFMIKDNTYIFQQLPLLTQMAAWIPGKV